MAETVRIKARKSGFDGSRSYAPGDVLEVSRDHARRVVLRDCGDVVDGRGRRLSAAKAAEVLGLDTGKKEG